MKVILLHKIKNLGTSGEVKIVKNGYARNYLLPKSLVMLATVENLKKFEIKKKLYQTQELLKIKEFKLKIKNLKKLGTIIIFAKSNSQKKIFGSVNSKVISKKITKLGVLVKKHEIKLKNGLLRYLGNHIVTYEPYKNISLDIQISILSKK
ncbi:50S ribosomal protein L9 [Buchnera aphidicola]|uniref:50S ribosomal protein L9 n=1 Tax=Buchnera aphidicola TaxID=9 RepID=UPI0031B6BD89